MSKPTSLHQRLLDEWGMGIVAGTYPVGSRISVDAGGSGVQASRTISREAVRVLEAMGMVNVKRRVGATVNPQEAWHVFDPLLIGWRLRGPDPTRQLMWLAELRIAVEPAAALLAAARATPEQWTALTKAALGLVAHSREADGEAYAQFDASFHKTLLGASGNPMFAALGKVVAEVLRGRAGRGLAPVIANPRVVRWHVDLAGAVQAGDSSTAAAAARAIVEESDEAIEATEP
ncbi:MAG: FCD domain-containing protein [Bifidobacteriaceae bacterium]|jgi:DNA-binding FadR family transcriptional regulator|nr:FCD domain-containing protein [Bifidobacteriaceae bacterium]